MDIMNKFIKKDNKGIVVLISEKDYDTLNKVIVSEIYTGIVSLSSDTEVLIKSIYNAKNNIKFIDTAFDEMYVKPDRKQIGEENQLLTKREIEVLKLVAQGCFNKEIAFKMGITERTVKNYVSGIFKKIDVCDRTQAAIYAIKNNMVNL